MFKLKTSTSSINLLIISCLGIFQIVSCSIVGNITRDELIQAKEAHNVTEILKTILKTYDRYERPFIGVKPVEIGVRFLVNYINHISEEDMEFQLSVDVYQQWTDPRLAFNRMSLSVMFPGREILDKIWLPDTYIQNARKVVIFEITKAVNLYSDGTVLFFYRAFVTAMSKLNLRHYPMDRQTLHIMIMNYRLSNDKIKYKREDEFENIANVAGFVVEKSEMQEGNIVFVSGNYSTLILSIKIRRRLGYFMLQFYFPCILCAVVSWLPFWMDRYEIGDRMSLGIATLLTEVFLSQYINSAMPQVSYIKAADEFILVTFIFIFLALMENVIVYSVRQNVKNKSYEIQGQLPSFKSVNHDNLGRNASMSENAVEVAEQENTEEIKNDNIILKEKEAEVLGARRSRLVDKISRILFPLTYILFVTIYFIEYGFSGLMEQFA